MGSVELAKESTSAQQDEIVLPGFREVGQILAEARKEQNLTIQQVANKIFIRQRYLKDIEEGDLTDLPGRVYILGFIRTYARLLNLDGEELIRRMSNLGSLPDYQPSQISIGARSEEDPNYLVLIVSGVLILLIAIGGYVFLRPSSAVPSSQEVVSENNKQIQNNEIKQLLGMLSDKTEKEAQALVFPVEPLKQDAPNTLQPNASVHVEPAQPPSKGKTIDGSAVTPKRIVLKAREPSWVEIRDGSGRIQFMKVLKAGEEYIVPDKPGTIINTGNAGGIDIFVGDTKLPSLGARGDVKRGIRAETLQ